MPGLGEMAGAMGANFAMPGLTTALSPVVDFVTSFTGQMKKILSPFEKITDIASHFVKHIDPSLVDDLGRKFKDLNAVIGIALRPVVDVARDIVKNLSDHMLPIMKRLQPIIEEISRAIEGAFSQSIEEISDLIDRMMPVIEAAKDIVVGLIAILRDLWSVFMLLSRTVGDLIMSMLGKVGDGMTSMKTLMEKLRNVIQEVIGNLIIFAARLMMAFGFTKGVEILMKNLATVNKGAHTEESQGLAIGEASFKAFKDLANTVQLEAFRASANQTKAADPAAQAAEFLGKIHGQLASLLAGQNDSDGPAGRIVKKIEELSSKVIPTFNKIADWVGDNGIKAFEYFSKGQFENDFKSLAASLKTAQNLVDNAGDVASGRRFGDNMRRLGLKSGMTAEEERADAKIPASRSATIKSGSIR